MLSLLCKDAEWWFTNSHYDVHYISIGLVTKMQIDANDLALNEMVNNVVDRWMPSNILNVSPKFRAHLGQYRAIVVPI